MRLWHGRVSSRQQQQQRQQHPKPSQKLSCQLLEPCLARVQLASQVQRCLVMGLETCWPQEPLLTPRAGLRVPGMLAPARRRCAGQCGQHPGARQCLELQQQHRRRFLRNPPEYCRARPCPGLGGGWAGDCRRAGCPSWSSQVVLRAVVVNLCAAFSCWLQRPKPMNSTRNKLMGICM